ncbi:hypothetical protein CVT26_008081 [Gymnopilus dilepis]|uniref:Uncharacterized protein n=1 Tax=Gymnopilus dilepis TaxID=231916 RepID=A0A409YJR4_9AGAR|nr:hypothetical protein CVT26_008081 [Gymnopilus dilepis]
MPPRPTFIAILSNIEETSTTVRYDFRDKEIQDIGLMTELRIIMLSETACKRFQQLLNMFQLGDAESFKLEMNVTNSIISGSAALFMFHPDAFTPNDIDIYVPQTGANEIQEALRQRGYNEKEGEPTHFIYGQETAIIASRLYKLGVTGTVNLIITHALNPVAAVVQFHSTIVMNIITADGLICLYPVLTLAGRGVITTRSKNTRRCFIKYILRGFSLQSQFPEHNCNLTAYCRDKLRSIEDSDILAISFTARGSRETILSSLAPYEWFIGPIKGSY